MFLDEVEAILFLSQPHQKMKRIWEKKMVKQSSRRLQKICLKGYCGKCCCCYYEFSWESCWTWPLIVFVTELIGVWFMKKCKKVVTLFFMTPAIIKTAFFTHCLRLNFVIIWINFLVDAYISLNFKNLPTWTCLN